ncbi:hypothetical protein [Endozoicomonas sp. Mp262]|uniref:CheR family methyltransferase n=1 Tax=Endozoicomonas sp. Mp262 TaxID=2919499 RepID=UPI0021D81234
MQSKALNTRLDSLLEKQFIDIIYQKAGIEVHEHQLPSLAKLIDDACQRYQLPHAQDYLQSLKKCTGDSSEFKYLADGISINESYFFRDSNQLDYIKMQYLPKLIKDKRERGDFTFKIWSAGCSEGQELYTLAILLHQQLTDANRWKLYFLGTDISNQVLEIAKSAHYSEWSLRTCDKKMKSQFFDFDHQDRLRPYQLKQSLRSQSHFKWMNLTSDSFPNPANATTNLDIIFCRNVFIYLHKEAREKILSQFSECLNLGGILMLGANDPHDIMPLDMKSINPEYRGFIKELPSFTGLHDTPSPLKITRSPDIQATTSPKAAPKIPRKEPTPKPKTCHKAIYKEASHLANTGNLDQADALCTQLITSDPENISYYCLHAWIYMELNQLEDAELALRRALFLNPDDLQARFQKSLYFIKKDDYEKARKHLNAILNEITVFPVDEAVMGWPEISYGDLVTLIKTKIEITSSP